MYFFEVSGIYKEDKKGKIIYSLALIHNVIYEEMASFFNNIT